MVTITQLSKIGETREVRRSSRVADGAIVLMTFSFLFLICSEAEDEFVVIDQMTIKFRTVNTGKLCFSADGYPAAAAHSSAVDHDWIEADHGGYVKFFGNIADRFHHRNRADCHDQFDVAPFEHFLEDIGDKAMVAIGTVIGTNPQVMGSGLHVLLHDQQALVAGTDDAGYVVADIFEAPSNWMEDGHTRTTANANHLADLFEMGGLAQRADDILVTLTDFKISEKGS